ncbi:MAG TPA: S1 RNA-binding domain-containing protein [Candidatus Nanoarchaeia archaeon]|nr:S1 RNA-binding domain-containing protein [Candidatus Nanoarchaeia archaeon]
MLYRREGFPGEDELVLSTVTKVLPHVVFVNLDEYDKGGLIHISEIAPGRIRNIREYVELGKKVVCKVLRVDQQQGHIDLSLRRVSEIERKGKLEEIKQEQKAEKVIELIAKDLKKKTQEIYDAITAKVFEHYSFVHKFFKDIATKGINTGEFIADKELAQMIHTAVVERFKPPKVNIKGQFTLHCFAPNGVQVIKDALLNAQKKIKKAVVSLHYVGGGKYKLTIEAESYKDAEQTLTQVSELVTSAVNSHQGDAAFVREGE